MPIQKVKNGYQVQGTTKVHKTKAGAARQLQAIKAAQKGGKR